MARVAFPVSRRVGLLFYLVFGSIFLAIAKPVSDIKTTKNRLHLDLSPDPGEQEAEIERILALGARRVDIGQTGAESWTVLADPEGNEFCVVRPKRTLVD